MKHKLRLWPVAALAISAFTFCGCKHYLAFGTATKFGLDITQKPDQTIDVTLGYDRYEVASVPVPKRTKEEGGNTADGTNDAYSVLGTFYVKYDNPWTGNGLHLNQFFATGTAAREVAKSPDMRGFFGRMAGDIHRKSEKAKAKEGQ